jgi:hypothetical protein
MPTALDSKIPIRVRSVAPFLIGRPSTRSKRASSPDDITRRYVPDTILYSAQNPVGDLGFLQNATFTIRTKCTFGVSVRFWP